MTRAHDVIKVIFILVIVAASGMYLFIYDSDHSLGQAGLVLNQTCTVEFSNGVVLKGTTVVVKNPDNSTTTACKLSEPR